MTLRALFRAQAGAGVPARANRADGLPGMNGAGGISSSLRRRCPERSSYLLGYLAISWENIPY
jgi:hypothetical protein